MQRNSTSQQKESLCQQHTELGLTYAEQKHYKAACNEFTNAIKLNPNNSELYYFRAQAYQNRTLLFDAIDDARKALAMNPNNPKYLSLCGQIAYYSGHDKNALGYLDKAVELAPNNPHILFTRAQVLYRLRAYALAFGDFMKLHVLDKTNPNLVYRLGLCMQHGSGFDSSINPDAIRYFNEAIAKSNSKKFKAKVRITLAELYESRGFLSKAIKELDQAIELNPRNATAYYERANIHLRLKHFQNGMEDANRAIKLDPYSLKYTTLAKTLERYSKEDLFKQITLLPLSTSRKLFNQALNPHTLLGQVFWQQRGNNECSLEKGTLKNIQIWLEQADGMRFFKPSAEREEPFNDVCLDSRYRL